MARFRILQLSDLHFDARSHYVKDRGIDATLFARCARELAADVADCLSQHNLLDATSPPAFDLVVLSGDLTSFGAENGFRAAQYFAEALLTRNLMLLDGLLLLPGNHDIVFGARPIDRVSEPVRPLPAKERRQLYEQYYHLITLRSIADQSCLGVLKLFPSQRIAVFGLDSCRIEGWGQNGLGFVGYDQLHEMAEELWAKWEKPSGEPWRRLAFVHHHLDIPEVRENEFIRTPHWNRKFSLTLDAQSVIRGLRDFEIDFVFHGHLHAPDPRKLDNGHAVPGRIVSAGSVGVCCEDCGDEHQFYTIEIVEESAQAEVLVRDCRRRIDKGNPLPWSLFEYRYPLQPRRPYARTSSCSAHP